VTKADTAMGVQIGNGVIDTTTYDTQKMSVAEELHDRIMAGESAAQVLLSDPRALRNYRALQELEKARDNAIYKTKERHVTGHYIYGDTLAGKTTYVWEKTKGDLFIIDEFGDFPFSGYAGERNILLDDYYSDFPFQYMLRLMNKLPMKLNGKGEWHYAAFDDVWITSNWELERQYDHLRDHEPRVWKSWRRRIATCERMADDGSFILEPNPDWMSLPPKEAELCPAQ